MVVLQDANNLLANHQDGLEREPPFAQVEELLEVSAEQFHHDEVVVLFLATPKLGSLLPVHCRNADAPLKGLHHLPLVQQCERGIEAVLRLLGLDYDVLVSLHVLGEVYRLFFGLFYD